MDISRAKQNCSNSRNEGISVKKINLDYVYSEIDTEVFY